jgi:hypothetical protein
LLLPVAIKLFPGMLPSTFQTATEKVSSVSMNESSSNFYCISVIILPFVIWMYIITNCRMKK